MNTQAQSQRAYREFVSYVFRRIKELEGFLQTLDEELPLFLRRVDEPGFQDVVWRDRSLLHFGRLSLLWEKKWNQLAKLLKRHDLLSRDTREVKSFIESVNFTTVLFHMSRADPYFPLG